MQIPILRKTFTETKSSNIKQQQIKYASPLKSDTISFKGSYLNAENNDLMRSIKRVLKEVNETLDWQSEEDIKTLEKSTPNIIIGDNIVFHTKENEYIQLNETPDATSLVISDKNQNEKTQYVFNSALSPIKKITPDKKVIYFTNEDTKKLNTELKPILESVDEQLFKLRMETKKLSAAKSRNAQNLPSYYSIPSSSSLKLKNIKTLTELIDKHLKSIPHKRETRDKILFGDYVFSNSAQTYPFKNVGEDKLQMLCAPVKTNTGDNLMRLTVKDNDNNVLRLYLIKDFNKIVSNINPKYPNIIPPKLKFAENKDTTPDFENQLQKDIEAIETKLTQFYTFLKRERTPKTGLIDQNSLSVIENIYSVFDDMSEEYTKVDNKVASNIKTGFEKFEIVNGRPGLNYKNINKENDKINIQKVNHKNLGQMLKIVLRDKDDKIKKFFLIKENNIIKNFTCTDNLVMYPPTPKFFDSEEIVNLDYEPILQTAQKIMEEHKNYVKLKIAEIKEQRLQKKIKKEEEKSLRKAQLNETKILKKQNKIKESEYQKELNALNKLCKQQLSEAIKNIDKGMDSFNQKLEEIRSNVENFIKSHNKEN